MAKKIYFKQVNPKIVATINTICEVIFTDAFVRDELSKEKRTLSKKLSELKEDESKVEINNKINVINMKRKALSTWTNTTLKPHKEDDVWKDGLFDQLHINKELAENYFSCRERNNYTPFREAMKKIMLEVFGMELSDKLINPFCTYLEHLVGSKVGTTKMILNGKLLKEETVLKFSELIVMGIVTYMSDTCKDVCIPTVQFHKAQVEYDKNLRQVVDYKVVTITEEKSAE